MLFAARPPARRIGIAIAVVALVLLVPAAAAAQTPPSVAIEPAAPFESGKAVVLEAQVSPGVQRLEWTIDGQSGIVGTIRRGELQSSVRFRPRGATFTATVQAAGPGGTGSASRTFDYPGSLTGENARRVERGLARAGDHRVYATGFTPNLTRREGACETEIYVGSQQLSGCLRPIAELSDLPPAERGVLQPLADALGLDLGSAPLMRTAIELLDGYASGPGSSVRLNGIWPATPGGSASIVAFPQASVLASSDAALTIAGARFGIAGGFLITLDPRREDISLGNLVRPGILRTIAGFDLIGTLDVTLGRQEGRIAATFKLPPFVQKAGVDVQASAALRATPFELIVDDVTIGPIGVNIGALSVEQFQIAYRRANEEWSGQGKACILQNCLDMVPPNGGIRIGTDGRLRFAGASLGFTPGLPLFAGVTLNRIGFGLGLDPTRALGNGGFRAGDRVSIDGRLALGFPSADRPFELRRDEAGGDYPDQLYRNRYTRTTVGVSAGATLSLPVVGDVPLGKAYVLYEYPGYVAFGGDLNFVFRAPVVNNELISAAGRLNGELNAANGRFNLDGTVQGCVAEVVCANFEGNLSGTGMSVCVRTRVVFADINIGGAIRWDPFEFTPYLADCVWGRYRQAGVRSARVAQAGGPYTVRMGDDAPNRLIMLDGDQGAPAVRVSGPGGQALDSPAGSEMIANRIGTIRILRSEQGRFVAVALADAPPGTYTIDPLPGAPPIARIREKTALAPAQAAGAVGGSGKRRVLAYAVRRRPNQTVTFVEIAANGADRQIGRITGGGRGLIRFSPAPGRGLRRIEAQFELDGVPAEDIVLARFRPPAARLRRCEHLAVLRRGTAMRVSWASVRGAARYQVSVTLSNGVQRFRTTRAPTVVLRGIPRTSGGRISVRAIDRLRQGLVVRKRFRPTVRPRRGLRSLGRCRIVNRRVVCAEGADAA